VAFYVKGDANRGQAVGIRAGAHSRSEPKNPTKGPANDDSGQPVSNRKQIVWHNSSTNETQTWFMRGERIARRATVVDDRGASALVGPSWRIVGTGNMNRPGKPTARPREIQPCSA
jgi:hypothetical protein